MKSIGPALALIACGASRAPSSAPQALPAPASRAIGAGCDPAKEAYACSAERTELLVCDARRWRVAGKCAGAEHCVSSTSKIKCDDTIADVGSPCEGDGDKACSANGSALLECTRATMIVTSPCRGPKGCVVNAGVPTCDRTIAEVGDACDADGEVACTSKGDAVLQCRDKKMQQTTVCNCRVSVSGTSVRCVD